MDANLIMFGFIGIVVIVGYLAYKRVRNPEKSKGKGKKFDRSGE